MQLCVGDVVIVRSDQRNRAKWPLAIVDKLILGKDGVVRAVKLRAGKPFLERPVQHLYPLELSYDLEKENRTPTNPKAPPFRPRRDAALAADLRVKDICESNKEW